MRFLSTPLLRAIVLYSLLSLTIPLSLFLFYTNQTILFDWAIIKSFSSSINLTLIIDPQGTLFSSVVIFISANVIIFAHSYMSEDNFISRFTHIVLLFIISMNFLIYIPNLISILLGWDGLGIVSFLLVIYYQNPKSLGAGIITALTNRIGDVLILLSITWLLNIAQWNLIFIHNTRFNHYIIIALIFAAITKRAQMPFSRWLPAAMAAPTPVSALVHSSTLVTAGVFLLIRFYPFLSTYSNFNLILLIFAVMTSLIAGLRANTECDIKKIIALSTLRQLGVIITSIALGFPKLALFHLLTHALFKALLFLCAGTLIHSHLHSQDLRFIGSLVTSIPSISSALLVANLALCGTPFLAGFYSKDLILEISLFHSYNFSILLIFFFATGLTVSYTIRFLIAVLWAPINIAPLNPVADNDFYCTFSTYILSLGAITGGAALNWILIIPRTEPMLPLHLKLLTITVCLVGLLIGIALSTSLSTSLSSLININNQNYASCLIWFLTPISSQKAINSPLKVRHLLVKFIDHGWEEIIIGQGSFNLIKNSRSILIVPQKNNIMSYLMIIALSIPIFLFIYFFLGSLNL